MPRTLAFANCIYIMYVFYPIHTRFASDIAQKCMSIFKHPSVKKTIDIASFFTSLTKI